MKSATGSLAGLVIAATRRVLCLLSLMSCALLFTTQAHAECADDVSCIGVGATSATAKEAHHGFGADTFTLDFGTLNTGSTSASQTIFVEAVNASGPATNSGTVAMLATPTITGTHPGDFRITGGTCLVSGPVHNGPGCTIVVAFRPTVVDVRTAQVNVLLAAPCAGCITQRTVSLMGVGTPPPTAAIAGAAAMSVAVNAAGTLDLAPFITGAGVTGVAIVAAPAKGTATVSGTRVTYTPNRDYFGADTFTYSALNNVGASAAATVSVTVTGRPDPSRDAAVRGLLGSQADVTRRFSRSQISNLQRRMESLHRGASASPAAAGSAPAQNTGPAAALGNANVLAQAGGNFLTGKSADPAGLRLPYENATPSAVQPLSYLTTFAGMATSRSLNLAAIGERFDGGSGADNTGFWMGGGINFGTRDQNGINSGMRFSSDGVSVGLDHRFSERLALGFGMGFVRDHSDIGLDGTKNRTKGASVAAYGSYQPSPRTYVDGLIGYGSLTHDSVRYVVPVNDFAFGTRKGNQVFGSIAAGYEFRQDGLLISPYGRLDVGMNRLKQGTETGAGSYALTYYEQSFSSVQAAMGLRAESRHDTNFGWALPRLRVELKHDFQGGNDAIISYADQFAGPRYAVSPVTASRNALLLGIGSDFVLCSGLKLGVDYQVVRSFGPERSHAVRLWLSKDLDGKGLSSELLPTLKLFENPVRVEAGFTFDNNINRTRDSVDKLVDSIYTLGVSSSAFFPMGDQSRFALSGFVNGDKFRTYTGLDRLSGGAQGEFQYRTSAEFDAVTFGLFGRATLDAYQSEMRSGNRLSVGVNARQALTDRIDIFAALARNRRDARSDVFDGRDYSARVNLDYALSRNGVIYLGGEYRRGDGTSSGPQAATAGAIAQVLPTADDAYRSSGLVAYRYNSSTVLWTVGYNWALGARDSLDFSWRRVRSTPTSYGPFAGTLYGGGGLAGALSSYSADQFSIAYLMRF